MKREGDLYSSRWRSIYGKFYNQEDGEGAEVAKVGSGGFPPQNGCTDDEMRLRKKKKTNKIFMYVRLYTAAVGD